MTRKSDDARKIGDESIGEYASPPCFLHELDPAYSGISDAVTETDVARWRKAERARLIAARQAVPVAARAGADAEIGRRLDALLGDLSGKTIGLYWPFKGEPDLRGWAKRQRGTGARFCLPVVVKKAAPLIFRDWSEGCALERGVWNIPIPSAAAPEVTPDVVISPVVGFDAQNYRLGYGGGSMTAPWRACAIRATGRASSASASNCSGSPRSIHSPMTSPSMKRCWRRSERFSEWRGVAATPQRRLWRNSQKDCAIPAERPASSAPSWAIPVLAAALAGSSENRIGAPERRGVSVAR